MKKYSIMFSKIMTIIMVTALVAGCSSGGGGGSASAVVLSGTMDNSTVQLAAKTGFWNWFASIGFPVGNAFAAGATVTSVVAASPDGTLVTAIKNGQTFSLSLGRGKPYLVVFLDGTTPVALLKADVATGMDAFPVGTAASNIDLGTVSLNSGTAVGTISSASLLQALGIAEAEAVVFGVMDDGMTRLSTVDANNNNVMDAAESIKPSFLIQYVFQYVWTSGTTFSNLSGTFGDETKISFRGYDYTFWENPIDSIATAGTWNAASLILPAQVNGFTSAPQCSINDVAPPDPYPGRFIDFFCAGPNIATTPATPPAGAYSIASGGNTLITIQNVKSRTIDANLNDLMFPVAKLTLDNDGKVTRIDWKWLKKTTGVWSQATDAEVQMVVDIMLFGFRDGSSQTLPDFAPAAITAVGSIVPPAQGFTPTRFYISWTDKAGYAYGLGDF